MVRFLLPAKLGIHQISTNYFQVTKPLIYKLLKINDGFHRQKARIFLTNNKKSPVALHNRALVLGTSA